MLFPPTRMLSAHSYFLAKTRFFRLQLKSLFLGENFPDFTIYQYFQSMTLSPSWCFPSQQVLWPALPAFNTCLLHNTVEGHGGKPLDSAVYNWNTRALYQLITAEWQEQMKDLGTWVQDFRFPLHLPQTSCTSVRHHQYLSLNTVTAKCFYCSVYSTHSNNTLLITMPN